MGEVLGGFKLGGELGGVNIVNSDCTSLPQDIASGLDEALGNILGANYEPIWYVGNQLVNGMNHIFIARQIVANKDQDVFICKLVVNIPAGSVGGKGAKVVSITTEADLDRDLDLLFKNTAGKLVGVGYKPIMFVGTQVVSGTNYYFVCEARTLVPNAEPRAVMVVINVINGVGSVAGIRGLSSNKTAIASGQVSNGCPLGRWME